MGMSKRNARLVLSGLLTVLIKGVYFFGARNEILRGLMRAIDTSTVLGPYLIDTKIILERYLRVSVKAGLRYNGYIQLMKNRKEGGAVRNAGMKRRFSCRGPPLLRAIINYELSIMK